MKRVHKIELNLVATKKNLFIAPMVMKVKSVSTFGDFCTNLLDSFFI